MRRIASERRKKMRIMEHDDFDVFFAERAGAAQAYVKGNGDLLDALVPHEGEATFFSPRGDVERGAETVAHRYLNDAKAFRPNGTTRFEVLHKAVGADLAFWTGFQFATVQIGDMPKPTDMKIRVTEIFRKFDEGWKLVHRHADVGGTPE
jgi:ketosteroid isomerase-like protein